MVVNTIMQGDCLEVMKDIPDKSVDLVLTDPPYGKTKCKWDVVIDLDKMWVQLKRVIKKNGAIVLFGSEPFSSHLRMSNLEMYKYDWVAEKTRPTGWLDANKRPLNNVENIILFGRGQQTYNPQMKKANKLHKRGLTKEKKLGGYGKEKGYLQKETGIRYPKRIIKTDNANARGILHPTQKQVGLMEYLILTYTNENEIVLDFTIGSGTTAIACLKLNRNYIGIEISEEYCKMAEDRIKEEMRQEKLF